MNILFYSFSKCIATTQILTVSFFIRFLFSERRAESKLFNVRAQQQCRNEIKFMNMHFMGMYALTYVFAF